jgi:hypothetical protein
LPFVNDFDWTTWHGISNLFVTKSFILP